MPTAGEIMTEGMLVFAQDTPVAEAVTTLMRRGFSGAPVVDDAGRLVGVLSELDCLQALASAAFHAMPSGTVGNYMTRDVQSVPPDTDLLRLTYLLHEGHVRRLPVVSDDRLVGLITRRDVLRALDKVRREREQEQRPPSKFEKVTARRSRAK